MPKRGAFALGLTTLALVLLLNFQAPSLSPAASTATGAGTGTTGTTGTTRSGGAGTGGAGTGGAGTGGTGAAGIPSPTTTTGPTATAAGNRTVVGPVVGTRFGSVQVQVTLEGTTIVDIAALQLPVGDRRTDQISSYVEPILRSEALQAQSANIDGISGATYTCNAYARSLQAALDSAGI